MSCDFICINLTCWNLFNHLLDSYHHHESHFCCSVQFCCFLLNEGYSQCQIKDKTGLGKGTISRISKEVYGNKENNPGGRPSKLSARDKQSIVRQIKSGKLENAVEATQFINGIISNPVTPQTVRNALKESGFYSATKKKTPLLKRAHRI